MSGELQLVPFSARLRPRGATHVIFVHGLGGDPITTWSCTGDFDGCWPAWLAEDFPDLCFWSLSYPAETTRWTSSGPGMALPDRAASVLDLLHSLELSNGDLIFVAHSLGGLLVKQMLRTSAELPTRMKIHNRTRGVAFLGTPHSGADLASFVSIVPLLRLTNPVADLKAHCPHLRDLGHWYSAQAERLGIRTAAYYETQSVRGVLIVNPTTADPRVSSCLPVPVDANHIDLPKPRDRQSPVYLSVRSFLRDSRSSADIITTPHEWSHGDVEMYDSVWPRIRLQKDYVLQAIVDLLQRSPRPWLTETSKPHLSAVLAELSLNAFQHGNANACELAIYEASLVLRDDGAKFNPLAAQPTLRQGRYGAGLVVLEHFRSSRHMEFDVQYHQLGEGPPFHNEMIVSDLTREVPREDGTGFTLITLRQPALMTQTDRRWIAALFDIPPRQDDYVLDLDRTYHGFASVVWSYVVDLIQSVLDRLPAHARLHIRYRDPDILTYYFMNVSNLGDRIAVHSTTP